MTGRKRPFGPGATPRDGAGDRLEAIFKQLREECMHAPADPGFVARFRARRERWRQGAVQGAPWRALALRVLPAGALAAVAALVMTLGAGSRAAEPEPAASVPASMAFDTAVDDPFAAVLEETGVASLAMVTDDAGFELLTVLYEPQGRP